MGSKGLAAPCPPLPTGHPLSSPPCSVGLICPQGIRIPTLGSFDTILERVQVGDGHLALHRPVFHLARNLAEGRHLMDDKAYMPGELSSGHVPCSAGWCTFPTAWLGEQTSHFPLPCWRVTDAAHNQTAQCWLWSHSWLCVPHQQQPAPLETYPERAGP